MPSSMSRHRLAVNALAKGKKTLKSQVKSMSNSVKTSASSASNKSSDGRNKIQQNATKPYTVKRSKNQANNAPLAQKPSKDHTEDTRGTHESHESGDSSYCHSEDMSAVRKGNAAPGPGSVEYSMAPRSEKLSVETDVNEETVLGESKGANNKVARRMLTKKTASKPPLPRSKTPKKRNVSKKTTKTSSPPATTKTAELTTISMPDPKYFATSPATPKSLAGKDQSTDRYSISDKADDNSADDHSLGMASTLTSALGMPPAPTVDSESEDDGSSWSSSDEESGAGPPMSTIGGKSRASTESTMSASLKRKKMSEVKETLLRVIHDAAVNHMRKGEMDEALTKFEDIRDVLTEEYFEEHHRVAATLHNIAIVKVRCGEVEEACNIFREAIRIRKEMLGEYHSKVAETLLELGIALLSLKNHSEALSAFNEALKIRQRDSRKEFSLKDQEVRDVQLSKILNNIGVVHFECRRDAKAIKAFEEALQIQREISKKDGEDDLWTPLILPMSNTLCNIACVHMLCEDYDEAIESFDLADSLQQSILEPSNPVVLNTLENLAYCHAQEGFIGNAMSIYEEMLTHQETSRGKNSLACAAIRRSIACIHIANCQYDKALECLRMVELIQESHLGPESRRLRNTTNLIQALVEKKGKFLSPGELMRREMSRFGAAQFLCAVPPDPTVAVEEGSLEELAEIRRPAMQCKMSGHKITFA